MKQNQYEAIITCIQYGAPALAEELINSFVQVVQNSNELITIKQKEAEAANNAKLKAEQAVKDAQSQAALAAQANLGLKTTKSK